MTTLERILNALKESGCFVGDIDVAIKEHEQLKNKSCEGCKYQFIHDTRCNCCERYYGDLFEPKATT